MKATAGRRKRSVTIAGHRTSVSLELPFWEALAEIASKDGTTIAEMIRAVDADRSGEGLSTALRLFVLERLRNR